MFPKFVQILSKNGSKMGPKSLLEAALVGQKSAQAARRLLEASWSALGSLLDRKKVVQEGPGWLLEIFQERFQPKINAQERPKSAQEKFQERF